MTRRVDLLVIGAGPAGSALALLAARAGARVVLVERGEIPRPKVCGEFVSAEGCAVLERLGILSALRGAGAAPIDTCRLSGLRGRKLDLPLPALRHGREGIGVSRLRLDRLLAEAAASAGAELRTGWEASEPILRDGLVRGVRARRAGRDAPPACEASVVVAADGRRSSLVRRLHPRRGDPLRTGRDAWFGLKTHLAVSGAPLARRVELHLFDGGYVGLAPVEDGRVNVCLLVRNGALRAAAGCPDRLLARLVLANPAVREAIGDGEVCGAWASCGPLRFGPRRPAAAGALFVGDAAGTVDPFCGEGMSHALLGAELALPFALEGAARGGLEPDLARAYRDAWRCAFLPVTWRVRALGRLFGRPRAATAALALLRGAGRAWAPRLVAATRTGWSP